MKENYSGREKRGKEGKKKERMKERWKAGKKKGRKEREEVSKFSLQVERRGRAGSSFSSSSFTLSFFLLQLLKLEFFL